VIPEGTADETIMILQYPCYKLELLKNNKCPHCGWKNMYTEDNQLIDQYRKKIYPTGEEVRERELKKIRTEMINLMAKKTIMERALRPAVKEASVSHSGRKHLRTSKPVDPDCTLPKAVGKDCNHCDMKKDCEEEILLLAKTHKIEWRIGKDWTWRAA